MTADVRFLGKQTAQQRDLARNIRLMPLLPMRPRLSFKRSCPTKINHEG